MLETSNGLTGIGSPAYLNLLFAPQPDLKPLAPKLYFEPIKKADDQVKKIGAFGFFNKILDCGTIHHKTERCLTSLN